jgi:hypothetical protein
MQKGVDQGSGVIPGARMDDHSRRFIDHQQVGIFKEDIQGKGFCSHLRFLGLRKKQGDFIPGSQTQAGLGVLSPDLYLSLFDQPLDLGSGKGVFPLGEKNIQALQGISGFDVKEKR